MTSMQLQIDVLNMMERVRGSLDRFYYGVRKRDSSSNKNPSTILGGSLFLGNDKYIFVPISPRTISANKTRAVGVVFGVDNDVIKDAWIEVVIPIGIACDNPEDVAMRKVLEGFLKNQLSGSKLDSNSSLYRRYKYRGNILFNASTQTSILKSMEAYLVRNGIRFMTELSKYTAPRNKLPLVYTQSTMKQDFVNFRNKRSKITDALNARLDQVIPTI